MALLMNLNCVKKRNNTSATQTLEKRGFMRQDHTIPKPGKDITRKIQTNILSEHKTQISSQMICKPNSATNKKENALRPRWTYSKNERLI